MYTAHFSSCASPINKIFFALHKLTPDLSELNISASHYQPFYGKYCGKNFIQQGLGFLYVMQKNLLIGLAQLEK